MHEIRVFISYTAVSRKVIETQKLHATILKGNLGYHLVV